MSIRRNTEGRWGALWEIIDRASEEAKTYPYWKRGESVSPPTEDVTSLDAARRKRGES